VPDHGELALAQTMSAVVWSWVKKVSTARARWEQRARGAFQDGLPAVVADGLQAAAEPGFAGGQAQLAAVP